VLDHAGVDAAVRDRDGRDPAQYGACDALGLVAGDGAVFWQVGSDEGVVPDGSGCLERGIVLVEASW
jgi:hypothetical protein